MEISLILHLLCSIGFSEEENRSQPAKLTDFSLQELLQIEVTSVSKKSESLSDAAAAVFVITQEDIRRSGATSIPEALRMTPGLHVARLDANKWAVSSRGFNDRFSNKLLVLIDGRSVYTPLFSGVNWEVKDVMLEDVERIEVIRGPGATLWGANAVNGVVNIITKKAKDTQGGLITAGYGTEEPGFGGVRYGGTASKDLAYRVYAKYFNRDSFVDPFENDAADDWDYLRSGFRIDWDGNDSDSLTLQGDVYGGELGSTYISPISTAPYERFYDAEDNAAGANLLFRWTREFSESSDLSLQLYYDWSMHEYDLLKEDRDIFDFDFQHRFALTDRQELIWGLGYRFSTDEIRDGMDIFFDPDSRDDHLFSAFLQNEITLVENRLRFTIGSKFEHNDYSGFEIQPNTRLLWTPHDRHTFWAAISRAVRTPSRGDHGAEIDLGFISPDDPRNLIHILFLNRVTGDSDFDSEELLAYEIGYRADVSRQLSLDIAAFYNMYDDLITAEPFALLPAAGYLIIPFHADNQMTGETYGIELAADWKAADWWQWKAAYTLLEIQLHTTENSFSSWMESREGLSPHHQLSLRSLMDVRDNLELDCWLRVVDERAEYGVPGFVSFDARLGWKPRKNLEISAGIQNAIGDRHIEYKRADYINTLYSKIERNFYLKLTWRF
jgi:iron complex outermembrane receptor protein